MLRRLAPVILTLSLLGGCAADGPGPLASAKDRLAGEHVFSVGFSRIADIYLEPVDMRRLALDGLQGLTAIDAGVGVAITDQTLQALVGGTMVGEFRLPTSNDAGAWAGLTARTVERLRAHSAILAQSEPEEIYKVVFEHIVADLDPYSRYTGAVRAVDERSQREGYGGIGITLSQDGGRHLVGSVLGGSPAQTAGIAAGEAIFAIDGVFTDRLSALEVGDRLRGPAGTMVLVTVGPDHGASRRVAVRRERVIPNTVQAHAEDGIGVLKVERFNAATAMHLREAIRKLQGELGRGAKGFVLDLRGNPGGLLDQAVAVADQFVANGNIISTRGRHPDSMQRFDATPDDQIDGLPLVVLLDGRSASAAEIVAAALQDSGRAVVVGASSFGKGSVQTVTRLPNDGELFLTWSRIYAPSGYTLHGQGVLPTVCTSTDITEAEQALVPLKLGGGVPGSMLSLWRLKAPEDAEALASLREACPWKEHEPALDLEVAKAVIADRGLYRRALSTGQTNLAER